MTTATRKIHRFEFNDPTTGYPVSSCSIDVKYGNITMDTTEVTCKRCKNARFN